ncbi:MAG: sialidase family protein [Pirellulales bacterium]
MTHLHTQFILFVLALGTVAVNPAQAQAAEPSLAEPSSASDSLPLIDLNAQPERQVVVDREPGQYLGHPTTLLLEDGLTMLCVYPKGHGRGAIVFKRSDDGGQSWSDRLPTPKSWETSLETPTIHRVVDAEGKKRIVLFSGLYPVRMAVSEDDGATWSELQPVGDWGGVVTMASVLELKSSPGHYLALFHDDGRFIVAGGKRTNVFTLYKSLSTDGGLTWAAPEEIFKSSDVHLCEPGAVRSPDGKQIAVLLRENRRVKNSHVIFSDDEGESWTAPREVPASLTGDRHVAKYAPDGRLFISFRDVPPAGSTSKTAGDWVGWVGTYDDILAGRDGQYRVRLKDNTHGNDCAYPGVEVLPDGTFVTTTYGHWTEKEPPYILSVRFTLPELDRLAAAQARLPERSR